MGKNSSMPFILTDGFNAHLGEFLVKHILSGTTDLLKILKETRKRATRPSDSLLKDFKGQTQALRGVLIPWASVSKADKPEADMLSEVKEPVEAERIHSMIKSGRDLDTKVVSHPIYTASVYSLNAIVDFSFHGSIIGYRQLQVVSHLELPARLAQLKAELPAVHLGSDNFVLGAKLLHLEQAPSSPYLQYNKTTINMASKQNKNQQQQTAGKAAHPAQHSSEQTSNQGKNAAHGANAQSTHKAGADKQQQNSGTSANDRAEANKQHHNQSKKNSGSHPQKVDGHH
ncbi:unnamed protein product [Mortierella alpina]